MTSKILEGGSTTQDTTDGTKLPVSLSVKQQQNSFSGPSPVYQELSMHHDWPVYKAIVNLPIRLRGNSKRTSGNLLSPLGAQN